MQTKLVVAGVEVYADAEIIHFTASETNPNPDFTMVTPGANLKMIITGTGQLGQFQPGQEFYVDFTLVE